MTVFGIALRARISIVGSVFASVRRLFRLPAATLLGLAAVLALGCGLRFKYYDAGRGMVDEVITTEVVRHMRHSGDWDVNWRKADLSPDLKYDQYNFASHLYATYYFYRLVKLVPGTLHWRSEREGFLVYRFLVALLACLSVVQTIRLGWRIGGAPVALGAGLLASVATLLVQDAHYVRPEAFTTVLMLAVAALCLPRDNGAITPLRLLGAAFCVGLLVACKISMLAIAWLPFAGVLAAGKFRARWWCAAALPFAIFTGFAAGAPSALAHPAAFWNGIQHLTTQYAGLHPPHSHYEPRPTGDMMLAYFAATLGWPAILAFAAGLVVLLRARRWHETAVIAGPVVLFVGYFATRSVFFERNLSHVVPLFCIVAAVGIVACLRGLATVLRMPAAAASVMVAGFALAALRPAAVSAELIFTEYSGRGDARHEAFEKALRARLPDAEWFGELYFYGDDHAVTELADSLRQKPRRVLIRLTDYRDERCARQIAGLQQRFKMERVADDPGTFPGMPTCTLLTYHRPGYQYYVVSGLREK